MLRLQEKAHFSLDEFRKGKGTPLTRYPANDMTTPDAEDELSMLGGKTRFVKKELYSPTLTQRSPTSQNPIVPLPLSPGLHNQLPPSVREYLDSFRPRLQVHQQDTEMYSQFSQAPMPMVQGPPSNGIALPQSQGSFSQTNISHTPAYGTETIFQRDSNAYMAQQQSTLDHDMISQPSRQNLAINTSSPTKVDVNFPQYFPVYDYGLASVSYTNSGPLYGNEQALGVLADASSPESAISQFLPRRRLSDSPETNMQTTWMDFVNSMAI